MRSRRRRDEVVSQEQEPNLENVKRLHELAHLSRHSARQVLVPRPSLRRHDARLAVYCEVDK